MKQERRLATALKNKRLDWQLQKRKLQYHFLCNFGKVWRTCITLAQCLCAVTRVLTVL